LPCSTGKSQCRDHDLKHIDLFDEHLDAVTIRSTDEFCTDENFFDHSYIIKYPGIPRNCPRCKKDLLHHNSYHFDLHRSCKFCRQNRFKTFAESVSEFESDSEKQDFFYGVFVHSVTASSVTPTSERNMWSFSMGRLLINVNIVIKPFMPSKARIIMKHSAIQLYFLKSNATFVRKHSQLK